LKILISSFGSRGDIQPMLALALELRTLNHDVVFCVPPNFQAWIESLGFSCTPSGHDFQEYVAEATDNIKKYGFGSMLLSYIRNTLPGQFRDVYRAARDCDLIVGGAALLSGRSVAEKLNIPYVYIAYCPATLPSSDHPPAIRSHSLPKWFNGLLWSLGETVSDLYLRKPLNEQRALLDLAPVKRVWRHMLTASPLMAADAGLAPTPSMSHTLPIQTGAMFLEDATPLPVELEAFLNAGEPPIYFGFGSMPALIRGGSQVLIDAAKAAGRRAIISQGWANLSASNADDCISIGAVAHEKLFPRVAAVVHHGGAGTTSTAARAGTPQVIVPHLADQYYWAHRVTQLGIGTALSNLAKLSSDELASALRAAMHRDVVEKASEIGSRMELNGARRAAEIIVSGQ
jgi:vancomycin aglycone glucosyltransferase